jgi:hypothetical protein
MKWLPLALALLTATPSHADEETKETGIRFGLQVLGTVVMYAGHCDVPLGPGVFGRVLGRLSDVLEASGVTQEEIKRYGVNCVSIGNPKRDGCIRPRLGPETALVATG